MEESEGKYGEGEYWGGEIRGKWDGIWWGDGEYTREVNYICRGIGKNGGSEYGGDGVNMGEGEKERGEGYKVGGIWSGMGNLEKDGEYGRDG
jgi:hypothetical protein